MINPANDPAQGGWLGDSEAPLGKSVTPRLRFCLTGTVITLPHEGSSNLKEAMENTKVALRAPAEAIQPLELVDYLFFLYLAAIFLLVILFGWTTSTAVWHLTTHVAFLTMGVLILLVNSQRSGPLIFFCRVWYIPFLYVFLFEEVGKMIHFVQPGMFDPWVLRLEARLFGGYPTVWLQGLANPWLTEFMSLCYMTYYFLIPVLGLTLYRQQRWGQLNDFILTTSITFFFCFLHYLFMPVAGPIFFTKALPFELVPLHGGPLTVFEQWLFFKGAIQGGAFPSSHVAVAVVVLWSAVCYRTYPYVFMATVTGLAISTVYNGYHYGVDVIYGIIMGLFFAYLCPLLNRAWKNRVASQG
jgi:membrane-associated phospholipid phosphatase